MVRTFHPTQRVTQIANWTWVIVCLIRARSVHLGALATCIPGEAQPAGRIARIRHWLANQRVTTHTFYEPLIRTVLDAWRYREITIILDGCMVNRNKLQLLRVSLSHCYRALPLAWLVIATKGQVRLAVCQAMLAHVASLVQHCRRVTFLADRGFRGCDWARECQRLGWDYIIRLNNTTLITFGNGQPISLDQLRIHGGQRCSFDQVRITEAGDWVCKLAITWTRPTAKMPAELCAVMTNLPASGWVLRHYLKRMHSEESFRDDKTGGFDLDATHLTDPKRLDWLLLAIAVAVLWIYELGEQVLHEQRRGEIGPAYKRQLGVFQLGWRQLRRTLSCTGLPDWTLQLKPFKPEPVWYGNPKC